MGTRARACVPQAPSSWQHTAPLLWAWLWHRTRKPGRVPQPSPWQDVRGAALRAVTRLVGGADVPGRQPGQLWVNVAHHRPDGGDPRLQGGGIRALTVGVELVDGLSYAPESRLVYRTHRRRLSGRRCLQACFRKPGYPQARAALLWIKTVDNGPGNPRGSFSSTQPVDHVSPAHRGLPVVRSTVSTVLSPGCAQRSRRVCTPCPHQRPPCDLVPGAPGRQNVRGVGYNGVRRR
jgi:hypothetical protein